MAQGEIYVEVDANSINGGIMPMAVVSGNPEPIDGQAVVVVWIRWKYDDTTGEGGYTGTDWYFGDHNNIINKIYNTENDFKNWLVDEKPMDLNNVLNGWDATSKAAFLNDHLDVLEAGGCLYFTANP